MSVRRYIKLILPLRLEWEPCYWVSEDIRPGQRVSVIFAGKKTIGVVSEVDVIPDIDESRIQQVADCHTGLDDISPREIELWRFIAGYYLCTIGEVYKAAYPTLKTAAEKSAADSRLRKEELEAKSIELWKKRIERLQTRLQAKNDDLSKKHNDMVRARLESQRQAILDELDNAMARLASFSKELSLGGSPLPSAVTDIKQDVLLQKAFDSRKPVILKSADRYGRYLAAAAGTLRKGKNVFVMVNEISLATRLCEQMQNSFGSIVLIHHSGLSRAGQRRINDAVRSGRPYILIGTRSAIFVPHTELGLIIVENEESAFYKQSDSAPRYNARDCAVQLARIHDCSILLGSVSPSLETILNTRNGKYTLIDCNPDGRELHPECRFTVIDIAAEKAKNGLSGHFSRKLLEEMRHLPQGSRIALIRGYEKMEDLAEFTDVAILTIPQAAKTDLGEFDFVAMLSADAIFNPADFRSDEHAFQFFERLRSLCPRVVIQSNQASHQAYHLHSAEPLLEERKAFNLPPFTRMIDVRSTKCSALAGILSAKGFPAYCSQDTVHIPLPRDRKLTDNKKEIRKTVEAFRTKTKSDAVIDVDPVYSASL